MKPTRVERLAARGVHFLLEKLLGTARYELHGTENLEAVRREGRGCIYILWHGQLLPLGYLHRHEGIVGLISRSNDGERLTDALRRWGFLAVRGSSSRGGSAALREVVRHAREGRSIAITPDGPRGPRQKMKPGAIVAAQLARLPIVPVACGADRGWWFGKWDRFLVPKPFARIRVVYGKPIEVPSELGEDALQEYTERLEVELNRLTRWVDGDGGPS